MGNQRRDEAQPGPAHQRWHRLLIAGRIRRGGLDFVACHGDGRALGLSGAPICAWGRAERSAPTIAWLSVAAAWALWPCVRAQAMLPDGRLAEDFHMAMLPDGRLAEDFHIERQPGALHVLNAPSPAATASLAIGEHLARLAEEG